MDFNDSRVLDAICYDLVLGEYPRSKNRQLIQNLANGYPPYTTDEVEANGIEVNINDLSATRLTHDARTQFSNAFAKTGNYFACRTDMGPVHRRAEYGATVTREANRPLRRSIQYYERQRAKFGMLVLHGISPGVWETEDRVIAKPLGVEDVLIPSATLLGFDNLPLFVLRRSFTGMELQKITSAEKRDSGWNMSLVKRLLDWLKEQTMQLRSTNWPETWAPEKTAERVKEDGGYFMGDQVPVVDTFDIYAYSTSGRHAGWVRRIILDSWGQPVQSGGGYTMDRRKDLRGIDKGADFLYTSRSNKVYDNWQNVIAFQFADLSAVFPARYHAVRSLGWLTYSACHMGNRLRCKFYEAVFEALMQQFKVKNLDDAQRALKLDLVNRGFIDDTLTPVPAAERWQVNANLVELGLQDNQSVLERNAASFVQQQNYSQDRTEKTRFQVMAELNATTQLVSAALNQAYQYEVYEDREMLRRLMRRNSTDPRARIFRANCLRQGVPEKLLNDPEAWDTEHERVMGGGNKTQELQIAQWLMEQREKFDPDAQRKILRDTVVAVTDDAARAEELVPEEREVSDSIHDTELAYGSLMMGAQVSIKRGLNPIEVCGRMLQLMQGKVQEVMQTGGVGTQADVLGLARCAQYVAANLEILTSNPNEKQSAKQIGDVLGKTMNMVKAMAQRQQQAAQKAAQAGNGNGGLDPKDAAKIQATILTARTKAELAKESHAQRTAQRQVQFEQKLKQDRMKHGADLAATDLNAASEIRHGRAKAAEDLRAQRAGNLLDESME